MSLSRRAVHDVHQKDVKKRVVIQAAGFNLGLVMCKLMGAGTPKRLVAALVAFLAAILAFVSGRVARSGGSPTCVVVGLPGRRYTLGHAHMHARHLCRPCLQRWLRGAAVLPADGGGGDADPTSTRRSRRR